MKTALNVLTVAVFLTVTAGTCFAAEDIELVSRDRAKELGLKIRSKAAGPDHVRVELEFETTGELKNYSRVALEIHEGGKLLLSSTLREEQSEPGRVVVSFAADRTSLEKIKLKVVVQHRPRTRTGHVIRVNEFADLEKIR